MCGNCGNVVKKLGCAANGLGILSILLAVITKLSHSMILGVAGRGWAIAAGLMLLLSISLHTCAATCLSGECGKEEPHTH